MAHLTNSRVLWEGAKCATTDGSSHLIITDHIQATTHLFGSTTLPANFLSTYRRVTAEALLDITESATQGGLKVKMSLETIPVIGAGINAVWSFNALAAPTVSGIATVRAHFITFNAIMNLFIELEAGTSEDTFTVFRRRFAFDFPFDGTFNGMTPTVPLKLGLEVYYGSESSSVGNPACYTSRIVY